MTEPVAPRWQFMPPQPEDDVVDSDFDMLLGGYPAGAVGNVAASRGAWDSLSKKDRKSAIRFLSHAIRAWRSEGKNTPALANYLRNADWLRVSPKTEDIDGIQLGPFIRPIWWMLWTAVNSGKRVEHILRWLTLGVTINASAAPSEADESALMPIKVGSPECEAWVTYCAKLGFRLPIPNMAPVIFVPSDIPPLIPSEWEGYTLIEPARLEFKSPAWWWRLYQPGAPVASLLEQARRTQGATVVRLGPIASPAEANAMIEISNLGDEFKSWSQWFWHFRTSIEMWPAHAGPIYVPTSFPSEFKAREREGAAA